MWTPAQLAEALGEEDGRWAADLFGVTTAGTFEHGSSVLRLARDVDAADADVRERWRDIVRRLRDARRTRPQPARDEKIVTAWNGLAITALGELSAATGVIPTADVVAVTDVVVLAEALAERHIVDGRLRRVSRDGVVGGPAGVLEDYGCAAEAFAHGAPAHR